MLPALPEAWSDGDIKGMRLLSGFELDMTWQTSKLQITMLRNVSNADGKCEVLYGGNMLASTIPKNQRVTLSPSDFDKK